MWSRHGKSVFTCFARYLLGDVRWNLEIEPLVQNVEQPVSEVIVQLQVRVPIGPWSGKKYEYEYVLLPLPINWKVHSIAIYTFHITNHVVYISVKHSKISAFWLYWSRHGRISKILEEFNL